MFPQRVEYWSTVTGVAYRPGEQMCHFQMSLRRCYIQISVRSSKRRYTVVSLQITRSCSMLVIVYGSLGVVS
jgi:hypothetical protein